MIKLYYDKEPSYAELWDVCLNNLYNPTSAYIFELKSLFKELGIFKDSKIIDVSAGTGFPALELMIDGYNIDCIDAMQDEIAVFEKKAKIYGLKPNCRKLKWLDIPAEYKKEIYNFIFCRGNSFVYAAGGWNKYNKVDTEKSLQLYEKTLRIFYDLLSKGGCLYIDKFKDEEIPTKHVVGKVNIANENYELLFYTKIKRDLRIRKAALLLRDINGNERGLPNITYLLTKLELIVMLNKVGFSEINEIDLKSEQHFDIVIARK